MKLSVKLKGVEQVRSVIAALGARAPEALDTALNKEADGLMEDSQALVPYDTGALMNSIYKKSLWKGTRRLQVEVGYDIVYALITHENPRSGQTGGFSPSGKAYKHWARTGQWKFLEQPLKERTANYADRLGAELFAIWLGA